MTSHPLDSSPTLEGQERKYRRLGESLASRRKVRRADVTASDVTFGGRTAMFEKPERRLDIEGPFAAIYDLEIRPHRIVAN